MSANDDAASPTDPDVPAAEREYIRAHSGLSAPFDSTPADYERLTEETRLRIAATQMSVAEVADLLGMDEDRVRQSVEDPDLLGLVMLTPQVDLRQSTAGPLLTPLKWLADGGDPEVVWEILTQDRMW
ncbi:hypothetical protein E3T43_12630 [Cryobacterium sp. Hh7]|uniref:hypothetical protein n=1 Tax=Cryobacterium sp. Hh7 TaxID=1259159 RepID=UPI00106AE09F|nr:hypothetical protein [Cryobacterium sp. Hh7]TFD55057.1 hypothetical protein E3T43_12630 [Cryobacterium sp. Hh7]